MEERFVYSKAHSPIDINDSGRDIYSSPDVEKAYSPMCVIVFGRMMLFRLRQPAKAKSRISFKPTKNWHSSNDSIRCPLKSSGLPSSNTSPISETRAASAYEISPSPLISQPALIHLRLTS